MKNKESGFSLIAIIITVIILAILIVVGIHFGFFALNKAKLEDIKTDMISIKTRAKIVADEYNYEDIEELKGSKLEDENILTKLNIEEGYLWDRETLDEQGLTKIEANKYVVKYDLDNPSNCEIYYLDGYEGLYSLTDLQEK